MFLLAYYLNGFRRCALIFDRSATLISEFIIKAAHGFTPTEFK